MARWLPFLAVDSLGNHALSVITRRRRFGVSGTFHVRGGAILPSQGTEINGFYDERTAEALRQAGRGSALCSILLNILVTSVCDMRCTHCFFTEELDDKPRKKLMMKTEEMQRISRDAGGNLGVLILAGGEPLHAQGFA
ncbi:MAG: hypothetical protein WKF84_12895 [Pyrinomonadaceae bacterium]